MTALNTYLLLSLDNHLKAELKGMEQAAIESFIGKRDGATLEDAVFEVGKLNSHDF